MSGAPRRRCPVCWQRVEPTTHRSIALHWDSVGRDICPAAGEPYGIAAPGRRRIIAATRYVDLAEAVTA